MKTFVIACLLIVFPIFASPQNSDPIAEDSSKTTDAMFDIKRNVVYNEDIFMFCYERLMPTNNNSAMTLKGGILIFDPFMPVVEVGMISGGPKNFFDAGVGAIYDLEDTVFLTLRVGYRYMAPKGFVFRISPIFSPDNFILPLISFGYSFD